MRHKTLLFLLLLCLLLTQAQDSTSLAQEDSHYFQEAGYTVNGRFLRYWIEHGGLQQQGYPISDEMQERSDTDSKIYTVQYFERAVFEYHPENQPPYDLLLSLLGRSRYSQKYPHGEPSQIANTSPGSQFFEQTGKRLGGTFLDYWLKHGGLTQQGYPISNEFTELSNTDGKSYTVQYFERAVFEFHPENQPPYNVLLSQLGSFGLHTRYPSGIQGFGIEKLQVLGGDYNLANITAALDRVKAGGLTYLRFPIEWRDAEPNQGQWDGSYLSRLDDVLAQMEARSIHPIVFLTNNAPLWARVNSTQAAPNKDEMLAWAIPPDNPADYGAAAGYLAKRFAGRVRVWEIGNEPDAFWNAPVSPDPARYTSLLKAAYIAVKQVDPSIIVLGGSLAGNDLNYLHAMYVAGAKGFFDALSLHPYCEPHPPDWVGQGDESRWSFPSVPQVKATMDELGDSGKDIWITELGWPTNGAKQVSDVARANYFRLAVQMIRAWPYVRVFIAYYLDNDNSSQDGYELWVNGSPTETWKAYTEEAAKIH